MIDRILQCEIDTHRRGLRPLTLLLHRLLESGQINIKALLFGNFLGELQGEAIGVIELKSLGTTDLLGLALQHVCQQLLPTLQGFQKARLLPLKLRQDHLLPLNHRRMGVLEECDRGLSHRDKKGLMNAQQTAMTHHST